MRFYLLESVPSPRYSGYHTSDRKWGLPGVQCPVCNAIWSTIADAYPSVVMQREALNRLQAEGLRSLKGCRTEMRFRKKNPPELLELELLPRGRVHADCLPADRPAPCPKCERKGWKRPSESDLILDGATLPQDQDLFRLEDFLTTIIGTERFVEAVRRLGYEQDIVFRELPVRGS